MRQRWLRRISLTRRVRLVNRRRKTLHNGPAALLATSRFTVLEATLKDAFPALSDNLIAEDAESRNASLGNRASAVGKGFNETLKIRLEHREEELLGALEQDGDVGQRKERGEDDLGG